jgi:DNA-binding XRE family transcriptional regulator
VSRMTPATGARSSERSSTLLTGIEQVNRPATAQRWTTVLDGRRLRQLRSQRGLSQRELAGRAGMSPATVARLEREPWPSCRTYTVARLAAALSERPAAIVPAAAVHARPLPAMKAGR